MVNSKLQAHASNVQIMRALIIKDRRFFRLPFVGALIIGLGCYALSLASTFRMAGYPPEHTAGIVLAAGVTSVSNQAAIGLTIVIASVFAGLSLAAERTDHTADFIAMLPVTRKQIVISKWLVSLSMMVLCMAIHLLVLVLIWRTSSRPLEVDVVTGTALISGALMMMFGVGWLFSSFSRSATISACAAIALTIATIAAAPLFIDARGNPRIADGGVAAGIVTAVAGALSLIAGTVYYLRRVEP